MNTGGYSSNVVANSVDGNTTSIEMIDLRIYKNEENIKLLTERVDTLENECNLLRITVDNLLNRLITLTGQSSLE
jgi:hypothetical protein